MEGLAKTFKQLAEVWAQWSWNRRAFVVGGALVGIVGFLAVVAASGRVDYSALMTNLDTDDAAKITESLDGLRVPYKLAHNGATIMVPADQVHDVRMKLASEGLPRGGGVGFEIFDEPAFGMSRFAEQLNFRRALEGELRRTIKAIGSVKDARVHIVIPKRRLFREKQAKATASVTLHMRKGRRPTEEQVSAVVHLVASSVEGVGSEDVTVVDSAGKVLARGGEGYAALSKGLEHQRRIEADLEARVVEIMERVVGVGRVSAQVSAELDFTQSEKTSESFDPETIALRSEQLDDEERAIFAGDPKGIPGARSNLPGGAEETEEMGGKANKDTKTSKVRNYEVSKNYKRELNEVAQIKRLSVAVLVDGIRTPGSDGIETFEPRTQDELTRLAALVKSAVGYDENRGDTVVLDSMSFSPEAAFGPEGDLPMGVWDYFNMLWRPVSALLFLLLLIGVMRATRRLTDGATEILDAPMSVRELEAALDERGAPALAGARPQAGADRTPPEPDKAAAVIKGWLAGG